METNRGKDELEGVEKIPREQAEAEMRQAVNKIRGSEKKGKGGSKASNDELDDVETISREQALKEMRAAAQRANQAQKKGQGS